MEFSPATYVVDDDPGICCLVQDLLAGIQLDAIACTSAREFLVRYDETQPALVVLDVRLPDRSGLDLLALLRTGESASVTIVVSAYGDVATAVQALKHGALDFLEKPFVAQDLLDKVILARDVLDGDRQASQQRTAIKRRLGSLTPREVAVLDLVVAGQPNKLIADQLCLSQKTVEFHRANVMQKMEAASLADLVRLVLLSNECARQPVLLRETGDPPHGARDAAIA